MAGADALAEMEHVTVAETVREAAKVCEREPLEVTDGVRDGRRVKLAVSVVLRVTFAVVDAASKALGEHEVDTEFDSDGIVLLGVCDKERSAERVAEGVIDLDTVANRVRVGETV